MSGSRRLYRRLMRVLPRRLREHHAAEMEESFQAEIDRARARGRAAVARAWSFALLDLLVTGIRRRLWPVSALQPASPASMRFAIMSAADVKFALRSFRRQPAATALIAGMLALGIAANVVVFSLVNGLFLRPFPFPDADRLVYINERAPKWNLETTSINYPDYVVWRDTAVVFEGIAVADGASFNVADENGVERLPAMRITHNYMDVLGVRPLIGRVFTPDEDRPNGPLVAMIAESVWRERLGGAMDLTGRTLRLSSAVYTIVGVLPRHAEFPNDVKIWVPLQADPVQEGASYSYDGIGRLKPGVSIADAEADLLRAQIPIWESRDRDRNVLPYVRSLHDVLVRQVRTMAKALSAAVALLLIVACANVAAVMLARAIARRREMGIRLAIGANRVRLIRQLFVENVLLAVGGGLAGIFLGRGLLQLLLASAGTQVPHWAVFDLDVRIAGFSLLITLVTTVLFGWAPALHAVGGDLRGAMNDSTAGATISPRGRRTLGWLVGAEFALAAVLLVGAGLLVRAFDQVRRVDPGFDTTPVLTFSVALPIATYPDNAARLVFWNRALERIRTIPGARAAGMITCAPIAGCHWGNFYNVEGRTPRGKDEADPVVLTRVATDGYFEAMGVRFAAGRSFTPADNSDTGYQAVIVNETFVRTFWPDLTPEEAIGKRLSFNGDTPVWRHVVGVARDLKHYGLEQPVRPGLYFPLHLMNRGSFMVTLRAETDGHTLANSARAAFRELDPSLALFRMRTQAEALEASLSTRTLYSWMLAVFAGLAVVLALGGTYGVTSYLVSQRTREIGIRVAVGAGSSDIVRGILRGSAWTIIPGLIVGFTGAVLLAGQMGDLLFGVSPREPVVLAISAGILVAAALVANWLPARRAANVDPMHALRP